MSEAAQALQLQHTEELLGEQTIVDGFDIDLWQYEKRDFSFVDEDFVQRSINRLKSDTTSRSSDYLGQYENLHPLDNPALHQQRDEEEKRRARILDFPEVFKSRVYGERSVSTLQEWECVVESVTSEGKVEAFAKSLIDISPEDHMISVPLEEFSPSDRDRISPGVLFRLIIGLTKKASGMRTREAICYLRSTANRADLDTHQILDKL
ncbi:hypothetical protein [Altererythrobacter sp. MF3-039]|uniref:hypothetical protein n=1 Tax=Altererythrobacter sp. MF3-039 TaxID=3252901 RepID=UPI00390C59F8